MQSFIFSKSDFINSIRSVFNNPNEIISQVRIDFPRMNVKLNNKNISYLQFFEFLQNKDISHIETILLSTNQCAFAFIYEKIFNIIKEHEFHLLSNSNNPDLASINIQWTPFKKTITWTHSYQIMNNDMELKKNIRIQQIMDIDLNDRIIVLKD